MKKIFFLLLAILPLAALAQNENRRVSIEPHAGMTISKMHGGALTRDETWKTGWTAGAELEIPLSTYYSLTTGVDYALIGTGFKEEKEQYSSAKSWINASYVYVPLQIKAYSPVVKGLAVHLGVEMGIMTSAKAHAEMTSIHTMDIGDGMSSVFLWENYQTKESEDVSGKFRNIMLNATYRYEIRQAISQKVNNYGFGSNAITARNHAILITLGYRFKL